MKKPRGKMVKEVREEFLECVRGKVHFWASLPQQTEQQRCDGVAFSILAILDGVCLPVPGMKLVLDPHEGDKEYYKERGENWYHSGMVINEDCFLHDMYFSARGSGD